MRTLILLFTLLFSVNTFASTLFRGEVLLADLVIVCETPQDVETLQMIAMTGTHEEMFDWVNDDLTPCWLVAEGARYSFIEEWSWSNDGIALYRFAERGHEVYEAWTMAALIAINVSYHQSNEE